MKEKIKELALQAKVQLDNDLQLQEFADLIVRECIDAIQTTDRRSLIHTSYDADIVEGTIERVVRRVKERFDV